MGFFKKRGKPRQYRITQRAGSFGYLLYELEVWDKALRFWAFCDLQGTYKDNALDMLRKYAALDAKVKGYGDNYEITEVL